MNILKHFGKTTFASLAIRNYRLYFIGQAISLSGTWMQTIAQGLLVLQLTNSGTMLGLIIALQYLPILILGPIGGVVVDRFPKQKILLLTQSFSAILALTLSLLTATHIVTVWMIGILALCLGIITTFDNPTRQTFAPEMVGKEFLPNAVALNSWEINLTRVIGPAIAGILAATVGLTLCFFFNGLSYIAVILGLLLMNTKELHPAPIAIKAKSQLKEGLLYVASTPVLRNTLIMAALIGTFTYEFQVSLPLVAQFTFHNLTGGYAELTSAMGIGAVIGGLFAANRKRASETLLIVTALAFSLSMFLVAISPNLLFAIIGMIMVGFSSINFTSLGNITLQIESLPGMRGRVMSLWAVAFLGSTPIGGLIIGWIGEYVNPRWGIAVGGLAALLAAGIGLLTLSKVHAHHIPPSVELLDEETQNIGSVKRI